MIHDMQQSIEVNVWKHYELPKTHRIGISGTMATPVSLLNFDLYPDKPQMKSLLFGSSRSINLQVVINEYIEW